MRIKSFIYGLVAIVIPAIAHAAGGLPLIQPWQIAPFVSPTVDSNAALSALPAAYATRVVRLGYATPGDSPPLVYTPSMSPCTLLSGAGDGGSQVPTSDGNCWIAKFSQSVDFSDFGGGIATYADTPFTNWTKALIASNMQGTVNQKGTYSFQNPVFFDVSNAKGAGIRIVGAGCNAATFNYTGSTVPAFRVGADTAGSVSGLSITGGAASQGSGYANGTFTNVSLTGGTGTGAKATVVVAGGIVTSATVTAPGTGYLVGDPLSYSGAGTGFVALVRGDNFYTSIKGLNFTGSVNGPLVQWGRNDMLDTINGATADICENNASTGASAEQVRVNSLVTSAYFSNIASGPSQTNGHSACEIRGAGMVNFFGSCSGMAIGMHVTATTAQAVFGNSFHAIDAEVDGKVLVIDNSGGVAPTKNTWTSGQWAYSTCAIDATAGNNNLIINGNLGGVNDYCNRTGILTIGPSFAADTNMALQALGINATTGVSAWPTYGSNSGINFNKGTAYFSNQLAGAANAYAVTPTGTHYFYVGGTIEASIDSSAFVSNLNITAPSYNGYTPLGHVSNLAALKAAPTATGTLVRDGYTTAGDGGEATYVWSSSACTLASGAGDNGSQVQSSISGCWTITSKQSYDIRIWGVVPNAQGSDNGPQLRAASAFSAANQVKIRFPSVSYWCNSADSVAGVACLYVGPAVNTTTTAAASGSTIVVVSAASFTNGALIGIQLTNGGIFHTTVNGAPVGTTITLAAALPSGASSGAKVFFYDPTHPTNAFSFEGPGPVTDIAGCGTHSPQIILGNGVNRPLVMSEQNGQSPTWTGMCWHGNKAQQTGWTGGPGGKLYVIQADDGTTYANEGSVVSSYSLIQQGYNGGTYEGGSRGIFYSLYDFWLYNGQSTTDSAIVIQGGDTNIIAPGIGSNTGYGILYSGGSQNKLTGDGAIWYGGGAAIGVNGNYVGSLNVDGITLQRNKGGCILEAGTAAPALHNAGAHVYTGVIFDACSYGSAGAKPDVSVPAGNDLVNLVSPVFVGYMVQSDANDVLPSYNIASAGGKVTVSNPSWGTLGYSGASVSGFTNNCSFLRGAFNFECAWTPIVGGSTTAGSFTYTAQVGTWSQSGNEVTVKFKVGWNATPVSPVGPMQITGLPIVSSATTNNIGACTLSYFSNWTGQTGYTTLTALVAGASQTIQFWESASAKTAVQAQAGEFGLPTILSGSCTFNMD